MLGLKVMIAAGGGLLVIGTAAVLLAGSGHHGAGKTTLVGDDFGALRREALTLFPRGSPVDGVATTLRDLGFRCAPRHRPLANINAPAIECDSAGRGYPVSPRLEITIMARNGEVSDIVIGNGIDDEVADARTPDPNPGGVSDHGPAP